MPVFPKSASLRVTIMQRHPAADDPDGTNFSAANLEIDGWDLRCSWSETFSSSSRGSDSTTEIVFWCDDEGEEDGSLLDWLEMISSLNYLEITCHYDGIEAGDARAETIISAPDDTAEGSSSEFIDDHDDHGYTNSDLSEQQEANLRRRGLLPELSPAALAALVERRACDALRDALNRSITERHRARSRMQTPAGIFAASASLCLVLFLCGGARFAARRRAGHGVPTGFGSMNGAIVTYRADC
jgi:hypothetical protein